MKKWIAGIFALVCSGIGTAAALLAFVCPDGGSLFHNQYGVSCAGLKVMAVLSFGASLLFLSLAIRSAKAGG
jgi:hypothetical protein